MHLLSIQESPLQCHDYSSVPCVQREDSILTEPTLTIPRCCRTDRPHTCTGAAIPSRVATLSEAFDLSHPFSPHDFVREALASPMARAAFLHGDVHSESRSWVKSFPPRGSAAENDSRRDGVLTVATEPVGGGNTAVAMGTLSREFRAKIFWSSWWSLSSVCLPPERPPRRAAHRPLARDLSFLWSASSSSGRALCPRQSASKRTRDRRLHHDLQRHLVS